MKMTITAPVWMMYLLVTYTLIAWFMLAWAIVAVVF